MAPTCSSYEKQQIKPFFIKKFPDKYIELNSNSEFHPSLLLSLLIPQGSQLQDFYFCLPLFILGPYKQAISFSS